MNLIKQLLREKLLESALIDEDYEVHTELQKLSNDVFKAMMFRLVEKTMYHKSSAFLLPTILDVFDGLTKRYDKLYDFMIEFRLKVILDKKLDSRGQFTRGGGNSGTMVIRMDQPAIIKELDEVVMPHVEEPPSHELYNGLTNKLYIKLYDPLVVSTILHELQHAYDSWRSKDKYLNSRRGHQNFQNQRDEPSTSKWSEEQRMNYLKQQHEINARFTQAISKIAFFEYNFKKDPTLPMNHKFMTPWEDVFNDFKGRFYGYEAMGPNAKKRLTTRLSKVYQQIKEKTEKEA